MMVADTSALISIIADEPERQQFLTAMYADGEVLVSTAIAAEFLIVATGTAAEFLIVATSRGDSIYQRALSLLSDSVITLIPFDAAQMSIAVASYRAYGRGRNHPARLNLGDTFAYALATARGLPLLFKGDDFPQTDVAPAR